MAGHSKADMSLHYTQADIVAQAAAVRDFQDRVRTAGLSHIQTLPNLWMTLSY